MTESIVSYQRPKSVLDYWLQLSQEPNQDFIRLLDYLSERDLGRLEIALSEIDIRNLFINQLKSYYESNEIVVAQLEHSKSHLDWILSRGLNNHIQKLVVYLNKYHAINFSDYDIRLPNLREIKFWSSVPALCRMLGSHSPNLQSLRILGGADYLTRESIETICSGCRKLKFIEISAPLDGNVVHLSGKVLESITKYCKDLEVLELNNFEHIESIECLSELTNLLVLDLHLVYYWQGPFSWPIFPTEVFASNTKLETVSLGGDLSHDDILQALGAHCHSLKHVHLGAYQWRVITDEGIIIMVKGCPLLESINISAWNRARYHPDSLPLYLSPTPPCMLSHNTVPTSSLLLSVPRTLSHTTMTAWMLSKAAAASPGLTHGLCGSWIRRG